MALVVISFMSDHIIFSFAAQYYFWLWIMNVINREDKHNGMKLNQTVILVIVNGKCRKGKSISEKQDGYQWLLKAFHPTADHNHSWAIILSKSLTECEIRLQKSQR